MVNEDEKSRSNQAVVRRHDGQGRNLPMDDDAGGIGVRVSSLPLQQTGRDSESAFIGIVDVSSGLLPVTFGRAMNERPPPANLRLAVDLAPNPHKD
jgi:hypothetical protein